MVTLNKKWFLKVGFAAAATGLSVLAWHYVQPKKLGDGLAAGNGRIEAVEIDVAAKTPGRIKDILVNEGDFVTAGQVIARMDTEVLEAQRREAEAQLRQAQSAVERAHSLVAQREAEKSAALAVVAQRESELKLEQKRLARAEPLVTDQAIAVQEVDDTRAAVQGARAAVSAAKAQVMAAEAAIATVKSQVLEAKSVIDAWRATIDRLQADINDSALKAPRDGRVQYRVAQPGEVIGGGSKVLNLLDLADVYMTFFLPTAAAGRLMIDAEVRLVLDAVPQYVIPARVSFVADVAQFTPKTVETAVEREKLMFRVKAHIDPELLKKHIRKVKTGLPGMAYVRLDPNVEWPAALQVKLPQ
ncbi:MAG: HlyD-like membrane fusion protein YhiI [Nitrospira sp.]|jgi:HlyD family secretion protein|nr:MAG: HlyD-like membrane fusion protein YhiI [Nitrospira sp.]